MTESNKLQVLFWKYILMIIGFLLIFASVLKFYNPDRITDWKKLSIFSSIGIILILINTILFDRIKKVKVNHSRIIYSDRGIKKDKNWSEVQRIGRIYFIAPPLYFAKVDHKFILFPTERNFGYSSFGSSSMRVIFDHSKMGEIIEKVKNTYYI